MKEKYNRLVAFFLARMGEASTIQGMAAIITLAGGSVFAPDKMAGVVALTAGVSALLKVILPDSLTKGVS